MSHYPEDQYWGNTNTQYNTYDVNTGFTDQSQQLDFQSFDNSAYSQASYPAPYGQQQPNIFTPEPLDALGFGGQGSTSTNEFDEPPLLEELEIFPERIWEKSLVVLNPFHAGGLTTSAEYFFKETDLAGPITFCLTLAACLFVSGKGAHFGYIYGLCIMSVLVMYALISLMCNATENFVSLTGVASILGYSILPIVWLSILGIVMSLNSMFGMILAICAIILATVGASKIFCLMTGDVNQRYLIAYPCALVYVIFSLLVLF
ncbi:protein YIPF5 [Phlebotomus argentipes]|uniref:protein YIPF5 n=1 Tax=Phlebotomus argentipes TaxID=94469 RepID=UPI002892F858|nr:protein YIPF5 [Phlebotomus argentipes]